MDEQPVTSHLTPLQGARDGQVYFQAHEVSAMLRNIAGSWSSSSADGDPVWDSPGQDPVTLDGPTVQTLAQVLARQADQIDMQCISMTSADPANPSQHRADEAGSAPQDESTDATALEHGALLLGTAERVFATFTGHRHDTDLSRQVIEVLAQAIDDPATYGEQLEAFAEKFRERLEAAYADYGPGRAHAAQDGRYVLAGQPEGLIVWERLSAIRSRIRLKIAWSHSDLPVSMLDDMAQAWGMTL
ncbi:hypothetical protein [Streptomyces sp. NPDC050145]|uniref:hypothetical protein n=1 Tax=Streptomyces sp. NPDC050145 TaxID=3365602 RepID=UPI0037903C09